MAARICDICGDGYTPIERIVSYNVRAVSRSVFLNDRVYIGLLGDDGIYAHSFDTCPRCSRKILGYVRSLKGEN